ncbi:major facilitator superfamily domain-containing protein [Cercophora samala]|uniref:Major facilitator superfamily domain-containing protein n=1 Tax=Cercophora samala TaxID=330535 RepID=A0AA39Z9T6_9PEZI|nr:major facilitator superfamily domain-containing protein [Cercophora samala]
MSRTVTATATYTAQPPPRPGLESNGEHATRPALRGSFQVNNSPFFEDDRAQELTKPLLLKLASAAFSFFVSGVNDGSIGALIPHIIRSYGVTTAIVSALYAASFLGWLSAAFSNTHLSQRLDLGAMMVLGAAFQVAAHALRAWPTPPFGLFISTFWFASIGQAFQDTQANTYVASEKGLTVHRWLGFIHAMYMAGCLVAPFAASPIASSPSKEGRSQWYLFYTVPLGLGVANFALAMVAFRDTFRLRPRVLTSDTVAPERSASTLIKETLTTQSVWLLSLFFFFYLGVSMPWVVEYLVDGVSVIQPVLVGLISATAIIWLFVPRPQTKRE